MLRKYWIIFLSFGLLLAACQPAATATPAPTGTASPPTAVPTDVPTPEPLIFTDGLGREITLQKPAQRVVSLAPSNTEILFAVGAGAQVVGRDEFSDYPQEALSIETVGGSMGQYSLEAIVALNPDLVLAGEINPPELVKSIEDLGLTVFFLGNPTTLEEMYSNLDTVGRMTGHREKAAALVVDLNERVRAVDEKITPLSLRPSVFYELDSTDPGKPWTAGPGTFVDLLIDRAGGFNIGTQLDGAWAQISLEQLIISNPDMILLGDAMWGVTPESLSQRPGWEVLTAVKDGKVYSFDDNLVSRPGPRLVDGLEALALLLHPEAFK